MGSIEEKQRHEMNKRSIEKLREKINYDEKGEA